MIALNTVSYGQRELYGLVNPRQQQLKKRWSYEITWLGWEQFLWFGCGVSFNPINFHLALLGWVLLLGKVFPTDTCDCCCDCNNSPNLTEVTIRSGYPTDKDE